MWLRSQIFSMEWLGHLPAKPDQLAPKIKSLKLLDQNIIKCDACPRLVEWRQEVAQVKRRAYIEQEYWGKPVTGFGPSDAAVMVIGLAPGAHGANRTGRIFTGDSSGDWLYRSLHRNGLAKIPTSTSRFDGQELINTRIVCAVRCVPPANKPSKLEIENCEPWLKREVELMYPTTRSYLTIGAVS